MQNAKFFPSLINKVLISWFGCGYSSFAPGTVGSLGALPLCWILSQHTDLAFRIIFAVGLTAIAILASAQDQASGGKLDPSYIVIDEVAGMLIATLLATTLYSIIVAFVAFRFFDIVKPFPASWFDKKSKTSSSAFLRGAHIVLDDVIAGIYALVAVIIFLRILS